MSRPRAIDCDCVRGSLPLFVGGDLDARLSTAVSVHLRGCLPCRHEASAQLRALQALVRGAERSAPAVDAAMFAALHRDVMARVAAELPLAAARRGRVAGLAAAAAVLFAVGFLLTGGQGGLLQRAPIEAWPGEVAAISAHWSADWTGELRPLGQESTWPEEFSVCGSGSSGLRLLELRRVRTLAIAAPAGSTGAIAPVGR